MKTIKTSILVIVFALATFVNYANATNNNTRIIAKKAKIAFKDVKKGDRLIIKDNEGRILHSEKVEKEGDLEKVFDFSNLENGSYSLELEKDFEIIIKSVEVKNNAVIFNENSVKTIFKPVIRNEKNRLMISKIAFDKEPLQIVLFYKNELIFSETVVSDAIVNRVYKLDEKQEGSYKVIVRNNNRSYTNDFKF